MTFTFMPRIASKADQASVAANVRRRISTTIGAPSASSRRRLHSLWLILALPFLILCGCCTVHPTNAPARHFEFGRDTFSFTNGLIWVYEYDAKGHWTTHSRTPRPDYWQHCFVMARACK